MYQSERGFSFAQVMIAAALLGGLALVSMRVMQNITDGQNRAFSVADEAELMTSIRMILNNSNHCKVSLQNLIFKKKEIDFGGSPVEASSSFSSASEGLNVELWYSNPQGTARSIKKFNAIDNIVGQDKSKFGKLKIKSIKLVMSNGLGACSGNYCNSDTNDIGQLVILYDKKINSSKTRSVVKTFDVSVRFTTVSGESTIDSCSTLSPTSFISLNSCRNISAPSNHNYELKCNNNEVLSSIELRNEWGGSEWYKHQYTKSINCCRISD